MKFGRYLAEKKSALQPEWARHCLDYDSLKLYLKQECLPFSLQQLASAASVATASDGFADGLRRRLAGLGETSREFVCRLDANMDRLDLFFRQETDRLRDQALSFSQKVAGVDPNGDRLAVPMSSDNLLQEIVRLEKFIFLNFTGLCKILKKHDKLTGLRISEAYLARMTDRDFYRSAGLASLKMEVMHQVSGVPAMSEHVANTNTTTTTNTTTVELELNSSSSSGSSTRSGSLQPIPGAPLPLVGNEPKSWFPPASVLASQKIIISMQGPHGTDIVGALLGTLAAYHVTLEDMTISRLYHSVTCAVLVHIVSEDVQLFKELADVAVKWDAELRFQVYDETERLPKSLDEAPYENRTKYAATVLNQNGLTANFLSAFTKLLLVHRISVEAVRRLDAEGRMLCVLEMKLSVPWDVDLDRFRAEVFQLSSSTGSDVALQPDDVFRKSKRLIVLDMDSTLIQQEVIDELARHAGVVSEVAKITHRAMNGELDFKESLRARVSLLKGSPVQLLDKVRESLVFTEGAHFMCRALKRLGYKLAVISGGFVPLAMYVKNELGLDYAFANQLKVSSDGKTLVGETMGPIVDGERKAELLEVIAQAEGIHAEQVVAVGDGANDLYMLAAAGLGIAFNAKPKVQEKARTRINQKSLKNVLYLLGHSDADIDSLLR